MYICFTQKTVHSLWATASIKKVTIPVHVSLLLNRKKTEKVYTNLRYMFSNTFLQSLYILLAFMVKMKFNQKLLELS